jgi:Tfp pilus assembly protein FimT
MKKIQLQRGFTFIELITILGLVGVCGAMSIAMSMSALTQSNVSEERDHFVALLLQTARADALANRDAAPHGIYIDNICHRYIRFAGNTFTPPGNCTHDQREIPYTNEATDVASTGGNTILFEQLSGNVIQGAGSITLANGGEVQAVRLRSIGQIDW